MNLVGTAHFFPKISERRALWALWVFAAPGRSESQECATPRSISFHQCRGIFRGCNQFWRRGPHRPLWSKMTNTSMSQFEAADLSFFPDVRFHFPVLASLWSIAVGMHWLHCKDVSIWSIFKPTSYGRMDPIIYNILQAGSCIALTFHF